jgi:hypothetical protein
LQDRSIDVKPTVLEGELSVIENEQVKLFNILQIHSNICNCSICIKRFLYVQGILENPSKAIAVEGSNNHALNPSDEVVLNLFFFILLIQFRCSITFSWVLTTPKLL